MTARSLSKIDTVSVRSRRPALEKPGGRFGLRLAVAVLLISGATYMWWSVRRSGNLAGEQSLEHNMELAQTAAHLLDGQCESVESAFRVIARRQASASNGESRSDVERAMRELLKGATSVEVYNPAGAPLAWYHAAPRDPNEVRGIIRHVDSLGAELAAQLSKGGGAFTLLVLARQNGKLEGIGVASYGTQVLADWLGPLWKTSQHSVYVVDAAARMILASRGAPPSGFALQNYKPAQLAVQGPGKMAYHAPASTEAALVGYACARLPKWAVLVAQPGRTSNALRDNLANLFSSLAILTAVLLSIGWLLDRRKPPRGEARRFGVPKRDVPTEAAPKAQRGVGEPPAAVPMDAPAPSPAISVEQGLWKCASVSIRGTSHLKTGQPCQDASYCRVLNGSMLVGAVADGAGSAPHGDQGAQVAAQLAVETLVVHASKLKSSDDDGQWKRLLVSAMTVARGHVEASAAVRNKPARQLASTLILFVAMPDLVVAAQIGDGAIVLQDRGGEIRSLTRPQSGEYINTTTFLVSPDAFKAVQQEIWRGPYSSIAALTDGLQMVALKMPEGLAHPQFFAPLFAFFGDAHKLEEVLAELGTFLRSEKITGRTDDDLTLMLATIKP